MKQKSNNIDGETVMITWLSVCVVVFICDVGTRGHVHKIKGLDYFDGKNGNVIFTVEIFVCYLYM